jgi:hypothetical protein
MSRYTIQPDLKFIEPGLNFVVEDRFGGELTTDSLIWGLSRRRQIWVLHRLPPREIVRTIAHEVEHIRQYDAGQNLNRELRARFFEREFSEMINGNSFEEITKSARGWKRILGYNHGNVARLAETSSVYVGDRRERSAYRG